ncbi:uncharacterized protein LOC105762158 [Gossypium raimondii]|uniref:uncharacterized protein LOC105762158 n=1 Tax=Gossypium raimondii TaxID=29730 RepID=UPI00227C2574|nr:uncharacterized protein LOC105762158 [Gossypium raimondii]
MRRCRRSSLLLLRLLSLLFFFFSSFFFPFFFLSFSLSLLFRQSPKLKASPPRSPSALLRLGGLRFKGGGATVAVAVVYATVAMAFGCCCDSGGHHEPREAEGVAGGGNARPDADWVI